MVYVRLARDWVDSDGETHAAGDLVDVDAGTLAELESAGVVAGSEAVDDSDSWPGPTWPGPTSSAGDSESWPGPTS